MENDELNQLLNVARKAAFFIHSIDGYENSKIANELYALADKVEHQKLLAIGRLAARVVYRNSKKVAEHRVHGTGLTDIDEFWKYWKKRWTNASCDENKLRPSANYQETRAAFMAGYEAAQQKAAKA